MRNGKGRMGNIGETKYVYKRHKRDVNRGNYIFFHSIAV